MSDFKKSRRSFLYATVLGGMSATPIAALAAGKAKEAKKEEEEVSPVEDLMREHGLLNRLLLVYDNVAEHLERKENVDLSALSDARNMIKTFIQGYHEENEEKYLFPRFKKANKLTDLVATLDAQHDAGRRISALIPEAIKGNKRDSLAKYLRQFTHMYRPHEAREDTVLYPAFRKLVSDNEYDELGEQFEDREHQLFGKEGFEKNVVEIGKIEERLGIFNLAQFTPKV